MNRPWLEHYAPDVQAHLTYPRINLCQMLEQSADRAPQRTALLYFGSRISESCRASRLRIRFRIHQEA